jgi:glycerol-3-phosphate responsive antiterminator
MSPDRGNGARPAVIRLPRVLVADDGRQPIGPPPRLDAAVLLRHTDLSALIACATTSPAPLAVDIDSIRGLATDDAAVTFLRQRLGIDIVMTRRPAAAARFAELGGLALLDVLAFDSTGLARSLASHPRCERVGTVISPGLVLPHMTAAELASLPAPVVAYGLISTVADACACLERADAIAVLPSVAAQLVGIVTDGPRDDGILLTTAKTVR